MATAGGKVLKTDLDEVLTVLNNARNKWGLASTTLSNFGVGYLVQSSHMSTIVTGLNQAISASKAPVVTSDLPSYAVGQLIKASLLELIKTKAMTVYNYCSCNCDNCSCNCNRCSCNCDNCSCDCDRCSCNCDRCSCNCDNCCDYCTESHDDAMF